MGSVEISSLLVRHFNEDVLGFALPQGKIVAANFDLDRIAEGRGTNQCDSGTG